MIEALTVQALWRLGEAAGLFSRRVWRVGHRSAPLGFVPHAYCSWQHRFDDPQQSYRTLYCAEDPVTCLREVLADLRPNAKARDDFANFQRVQGIPIGEMQRPARDVTARWRAENALASAVVERDGPLANLDERALLEQLADTHAGLLAAYGMTQLDITDITSKTRPVTQAISRDLFDRSAAGLLFRSNLDSGRCIVLFEGRARLRPASRPTLLSKDHPALLQVCSEYGLVLRSSSALTNSPRFWRP